jgi:preprotein translocase subunit SecA
VYKRTLLSIIDQLWIEHMDNIEFLQKKLAFLWYAEQDPLVEFKKESYNKFITLIDNFYIDW